MRNTMSRLYTFNNAGPSKEEYEILMDASKGMDLVLEFGPGSSTFAFIEAGVKQIISCEYQQEWMDYLQRQFQDYDNVELVPFNGYLYPLSILYLDDLKFDMIFVDSPIGLHGRKSPRFENYEDCSRWNTLNWAVEHSDCVYLHDAHREGETNSLNKLKDSCDIQVFNTEKGLAKIVKHS